MVLGISYGLLTKVSYGTIKNIFILIICRGPFLVTQKDVFFVYVIYIKRNIFGAFIKKQGHVISGFVAEKIIYHSEIQVIKSKFLFIHAKEAFFVHLRPLRKIIKRQEGISVLGSFTCTVTYVKTILYTKLYKIFN